MVNQAVWRVGATQARAGRRGLLLTPETSDAWHFLRVRGDAGSGRDRETTSILARGFPFRFEFNKQPGDAIWNLLPLVLELVLQRATDRPQCGLQ